MPKDFRCSLLGNCFVVEGVALSCGANGGGVAATTLLNGGRSILGCGNGGGATGLLITDEERTFRGACGDKTVFVATVSLPAAKGARSTLGLDTGEAFAVELDG